MIVDRRENGRSSSRARSLEARRRALAPIVAFVVAFGSLPPTVLSGQNGSVERTSPPAGVVEREVVVGMGEWAVSGVLALPAAVAGRVPGVVLMHGSGPGTRDGEVGPNRIYREMAWALASRGIAVLRYDKRTTAHADQFRARGHEATMEEEHTEDGVSAVGVLRAAPEVDRAFILANSQSTAVAAEVAERAGGVAGLILAGVGSRSPLEMIIDQATYTASLAAEQGNPEQAGEARELARLAGLMLNGEVPDTTSLLGRPYSYWRAMDPERALETTSRFLARGGRLLVVHGGRDYLTTDVDISAWEARLGAFPRATFKRYEHLNHLMQPGTARMTPEEYTMKMDISVEYIDDVAEWISAAP
jgi:uncharacterized protein